jgi:uncharacterized repeat protein (TIGR01451 family)
MNLQKTLTTSVLAVAFLAAALPSFADGSTSQCQVIYGGGEVCNQQIQFSLNKLVQVPGKGGGDYVDNLNANDPKYTAGQTVNYKVVITNTGNSDINHIKATDTLPTFLTFVSGNGQFDSNSNTLTFDVNNLSVGKAQEFIITAKVADNNTLPSNQTTICVINHVTAVADNGDTASDSSQACIAKQIVNVTPTPQVFTTIPPKSIPNTGPEMLPLLGLIPAGLAGLKLRGKKLN